MINVKLIPNKLAHPWLLEWHYAKRLPCITRAFGLYDENEILRGVCCFGFPASPFLCRGICGDSNKAYVRELNRLVIDDIFAKEHHNIASRFVSECLKKMYGHIIVSYADTKWGHVGTVYKACNFFYTGCTRPRTDIYAGNGRHARHHKGDTSIRQQRSAKHRYVFFSCSKTQRKRWLKALNYAIKPYPTGTSLRYETPSRKLL